MERIQFRVCVVLKHWLEWQLFDFDKDLIAELSEFIDQLSQHSNKVHPPAQSSSTHHTVFNSEAPLFSDHSVHGGRSATIVRDQGTFDRLASPYGSRNW